MIVVIPAPFSPRKGLEQSCKEQAALKESKQLRNGSNHSKGILATGKSSKPLSLECLKFYEREEEASCSKATTAFGKQKLAAGKGVE